ncbi:leucine-rich repeat protein 1-like isoform X2 [Antedon mediterranea]|uniref:leucine-rich repeat protein 1-like isoform X2 n=1 Tax=Antedon mediterranea TaxID=105859 RepID=UPI003AF67A8D
MRLTCNAEVVNRQLSAQGMRKKSQPIRTFLSIGRSKSTDSKTGAIFLMVCTAKDRVGTKYKADQVSLKHFLSIVKLGHQNRDMDKVKLSILAPATSSQVEPLKVRLNITDRQNYPLANGFPRTLETLRVCNCMLKKVDSRILMLKQLRSLDFSNNRFQTLPEQLSQIPTLAELKLTGNFLLEVPKCIWTGKLQHSLKMLDLSDNKLQYISPDITKMSSLVRLNLNSNEIKKLPSNFGQLSALKFFSAARNKLRNLPATFGDLRMEELDLSGNEFEKDSDIQLLNQDYIVMPLTELAARIVAKFRLPHDPSTLPAYLCKYLMRTKMCVCSRECILPYATALRSIDLRQTAHIITRTENTGVTAPLQTFLCSTRCYKNILRNSKCLWKCKR